MESMLSGNSLDSIFVISDKKSRRVSSFDKTGGNMDWMEVGPNEKLVFADIQACGVVRHIWCTSSATFANGDKNDDYLRTTVLRAYWDNSPNPSVEVPLGDFFGMGHGKCKNFVSAAFAMSPQDGKGFSCYFPMPFRQRAVFEIENQSDAVVNFYFYVDYEICNTLPDNAGYFHARYSQERNTDGWAKTKNIWDEKTTNPALPSWLPTAWEKQNLNGEDNYVILEAFGKGKYVGCNLNIDVFERQANDWYGEGDDMIFIDGDTTPTLSGTGTEDYFNTAYCPRQEFAAPYHGVTLYSGEEAGFLWGGKNSVYRLHLLDPIHFEKSIKVTIEHGHANKLSNDYSSTAYWYQEKQHEAFGDFPKANDRIPRKNPWEKIS